MDYKKNLYHFFYDLKWCEKAPIKLMQSTKVISWIFMHIKSSENTEAEKWTMGSCECMRCIIFKNP